MNAMQKAAYESEIAQAKALMTRNEHASSFAHLERAHVIGQAYVLPHVKSHWLMLRVELQRHRPAAVIGQVIRIVLGALGSAVGVVPTGNTGGTDISMFKRLPIPPDMCDIIAARLPEATPEQDDPRKG
jgi:hypothetical protein